MTSAAAESTLFTPLQVGKHTLSHRLVLAPLTRFRASPSHIQLPFVKDYYAQRACVPGTLLITEATFISSRASGYANVPGIWTDKQIAAWKEVTDAVHAKGSVIYCQLWALGRAAVAKVIEGETDRRFRVASSSATPMPGKGKRPPAEMSEEEIQIFIEDYAQAAVNAVNAGFDGVEIHGANGYLVDQFIQDVVNKRTDGWGGSIEKRGRFALAVAEACVDAVGADKVGIRLSPWSVFQGMGMKDPLPQFSYVIKGLKDLGLAYVHLVESRIAGPEEVERKGTNEDVWATGNNDELIKIWQEGGNKRPIFLAGGFKPDTAKTCVEQQYPGQNVAIVFGRRENTILSTRDQLLIVRQIGSRTLIWHSEYSAAYP